MQTPERLGKPQRKGLGHRTSLLQGPLPAADPLISGNKGGRESSSKIARGVGGVKGCRGPDAMSYIASISGCQSQQKKRSTWLTTGKKRGKKEGEQKVLLWKRVEGFANLRSMKCVPASAHVVVRDFLNCSLWSDSLTNCGSSGCINFLTPQAAVFSLIDFSSQTSHTMGKECAVMVFRGAFTTRILSC